MPEESEQKQATRAVKALAQFIAEPETDELSDKEIRAQLSQAGVNLEDAKKRLDALIVQAKGRALLSNAAAQRQTFMSRVLKCRNSVEEGKDIREQISNVLHELFGDRAQAAVAWRNFEHASDSDLRSMLDDMTLLEELEKDDSRGPQT